MLGVTFFERMSGEVVDEAGETHHLAFDLRCAATDLPRMLVDGWTRGTGTVTVLPWADGAACDGTVRVRPVTARSVAYDIGFRGTDGARWTVVGTKHVDPLHPVRTMTEMRVTLSREGEVVATGRMEFVLDDLPSFLRSWRPTAAARPAREAGRPEDAPGTLSAAERAVLGALAEAVVEPYGSVPAADAETTARTERILPFLPPGLLLGYRSALRGLDLVARARHGRGYADLTVPQRRRLLDLAGTVMPVGAEAAAFALTAPIKMAHFSRRDYLDAVGQPDYDVAAEETPPRWMAGVAAPEALPADSTYECDVVVVGTGAGGGAAAAALAEAGLAVVMVEEGRYERRPEFVGGPEQRMLRYWRDGGMTVALGNAVVGIPTGRLVGGSTAINSGTSFRTPDAVLAEWRALGLPADFDPDAFGRLLDRVEAELGIAPGDPRYLGRIAEVVGRGVDAMGGTHGPLPRNAPDCDGQGLCVFGCPTDAKRSSNVSWVPRSLRAGAQLVTGLPVTRILMDGRRAVGVVASGQDRHGAPRRVEIRSRAVVLAAGALQTPVLLRTNGVDLPWLGRNLSIHPALGALALMPDVDGQPWRAIPQGYGAEGIGDPLVRFEGCYQPAATGSALMPYVGAELSRWMDAWERVEHYGFMVRDRGVGTVSVGPGGRPVIRYSVTPRVLDAMRAGSAALAELLLLGGAEEVATRIDGVGSVRTVAEARAIGRRRLAPHDFSSMGFHPLGTARMGRSPDDAVVDADHRVFGTEGLYVADGSCVPTSLGVNPQVTIMAMGLRAAAVIGADLGARDALAARHDGVLA